jgi:hypothetical protein
MPATDLIARKMKNPVGRSNVTHRMAALRGYLPHYQGSRYVQLSLPLYTITDKRSAIESARLKALSKHRYEGWNCYGLALYRWIASDACVHIVDVEAYLGVDASREGFESANLRLKRLKKT